MKTKITLALALLTAAFTSCNKENEAAGPGSGNPDLAYVSLMVKTPSAQPTKASVEDPASATENALKTLYAVTFDDANAIICFDDAAVPITDGLITDGSVTEQEPDPFKVPAAAKTLLLIANPGPKLLAVLNAATEGTPFSTLNYAIGSVTDPVANTEISGTNGYTMINVGATVASDTDTSDPATLCLVDISAHIKVVGKETGQYEDDEKAIAAANGDRVTLQIERLSSKIGVGSSITDGAPDATKVLPVNQAIFTFKGWVLDGVNSIFYPWAKRVKLTSTPSTPEFYTNNFYTIDPNYTDNTGILYHTIKADYTPDVTFLLKDATVYSLENTMQSPEQRFKNATRITIQAEYYYDQTWKTDDGDLDWFSYAGLNYKNFADLLTAYNDQVNPKPNLVAACDKFYLKVKAYADDNGITPFPADFKSLTTAALNQIKSGTDPIGGEVVKEEGCVLWYQAGLCYYWYEIRHDDAQTGVMEFAKYGVVRNNYYNLTLDKVKGAGTPWFPDIVNPGPGDPKPEDPIDKQEGYIGVTVEIAPWVRWNHSFEV